MYKSILLPVDLDQESSWKKALPVAIALAGLSGATIHLITVVPDLLSSHVAPYFPPGFEAKVEAETKAKLTQFANDKLSGVPHEVHVRSGTIYEQILEAAEEIGCDLIVIVFCLVCLQLAVLEDNS